MAGDLASDKFWVNKNLYHDAEKKYQENLAKLLKRGQRRLEVGENSDLANFKSKRENNRLRQKNIGEAVKEEIYKLKAQGTLNKTFKSDTLNCVSGAIHQDGSDSVKNNLIIPDEAEEKKERNKKKNKSLKKSEKIKEKDHLLGGVVGMAKLNQDTFPKTTLAGEVARARQHIKSSLECMGNLKENGVDCMMNPRLSAVLEKIEKSIESLCERVTALEIKAGSKTPAPATCTVKSQTTAPTTPEKPEAKDDDDDLDLFASDSEEKDEEADAIKKQRLAEYAAKKSKKPAVVAKSNIILDIKPWDDTTDMKEMEKAVRAIEMDGLLWGASKLVPVAFKIFKLQIACVIEDDKVSVDSLTETLEGIESYVQSVDIAAFNKV